MSTQETSQAAFGTWPSPIDAKRLTQGARGYSELNSQGGALYWLESRPEESGRTALVRYSNGQAETLTPAPFNARSGVHEYGGGAYCLGRDVAYFVNFKDQNIYHVPLEGGAEPEPVTTGGRDERFADLAFAGDHLLAVRERHTGDAVINDLVAVALADGAVRVLHEGHDFYSSPRLSNPGGDGRVALIAWDHPNMPWDGTQLLAGDYRGGALENVTVIAGAADESIVEPSWSKRRGEDEPRLLFVSDLSGYWNLCALDDSGLYRIFAEEAEYSSPAWQFGMRLHVVLDSGHVAVRRTEAGEQSLVLIDSQSGLSTPLQTPHVTYNALTLVDDDAGLAFIGGLADGPTEIARYDFEKHKTTVIAAPDVEALPRDAVSIGQDIRFPAPQGESHAYFYPPNNGVMDGLPGELPPLLVLSHGGPTAYSTRELSLKVQYYTTRGWAVADVNYGGSTGFGRAYRERLDGNWGVTDVEDCIACVRHLVAQGQVDPARVAIKGGSAGGYTTLAALVGSTVFKAGASHYGIGDLQALARDTHKFEERYLHRLIPEDAMDERSPINHVEQLTCPVIFFQGTDDRVVPPNQSEAMRDALREKGIPVRYVLFEGEGHGFRKAENIERAVEEEYAFFARIFGIDVDAPPGFVIENLD